MATVPLSVSQDADSTTPADASPLPVGARRTLQWLGEWLILAWVVWWSWAYVRTALAHRFPEWLGWTTRLW